MIRQDLHIRDYGWHLIVLYNANRNLDVVAEILWSLGCDSSMAKRAVETITRRNTGFCFTNDKIKVTLMCVSDADTDEELINTIAHELKHFQSHVFDYYGKVENGEEAAYFVGDTMEKLYNVFKYELEQS